MQYLANTKDKCAQTLKKKTDSLSPFKGEGVIICGNTKKRVWRTETVS